MPNIENTGVYDVTVVGVEFAQTPNTGTPYIGLKFETADGLHAYRNLYLSDKAFEYSDKNLKEVFSFDGDYQTVEDQVKGKPCRITIETEADDKGVERLVVKWINKIRTITPVANEADFRRQLTAKSARFGGKAAPKAFPAKKTEDNVPF